MKINNKGFSFVEILAVIMIIGILTSIAVVGITRYRTQAENKNYEALAKSSYAAMEEYLMTYNYSKPISLEELEKGNFLSNRIDPVAKNKSCTGSVEYEKSNGSSDVIDSGIITVYLCCSNFKRKYTYPEGKVEKFTNSDKCMNDGSGDTGDDGSITCTPGNYLPQSSNECQKCPSNYYCPGGTFYYNDNKEQGKNKCSTDAPGYAHSNEGSDAINDCYMNVPENKYIKTARDEEPTNCSSGKYKDAHTVKFGKISSCDPATIEVTFDCNGGTLDSGPATATYQSDETGQKFNTKCKKAGYVQDGWKRDKTSTSSNYTTDSNVTENFILTNKPRIIIYAHWKQARAYIYYSANGGKFNTTYTPAGFLHDDGTPFWKSGMNRYWEGRDVTIDGVEYSQIAHIRYADESSFTILKDEILYGDTLYFHGDGLTDYNWEYFMYITNSSANAAPYDKEWKCLSANCAGKLYSENLTNYVSTDFCESDYNDCSVVLGVNWQ